MKICHNQPHLVPPMKLVFYDDLPSPGPGPGPTSRSSLLPLWINEGRNLASRASNRASMLVKRKASKRPTISAPSDFRRVEPPRSRLRSSFRPLELSIYMPGNRLSDLPEFDDFEELGIPSPPPKALTCQFDKSRARRCESAPFHVARKAVGSGSRRQSSVATLDQVTELGNSVANPLIPHFSSLTLMTSPTPVRRSLTRPRPLSNPLDRVQESIPSSLSSPARDKPLPSTPDKESNWPPLQEAASRSPSDRQSFDHFRNDDQRRFSPVSPLHSSPQRRKEDSTSSTKPVTTASPPRYNRSRTMSDSTISSSTITSGHGTTASLSSAVTATTATFHFPTMSDKEIEAGGGLPVPLSPKYIGSYPRVLYEEPVQEQVHEPVQQSPAYEYDRRFPSTPVGLAF
jgi:hypothetical protein